MATTTKDSTTALKRILLFGREADDLAPELARYDHLTRVQDEPDVVVCFGGDGTLLDAEAKYPGLPKVPILNSRRGHRCIPHPPGEVLRVLAAGELVRNDYTKITCHVHRANGNGQPERWTALNEFATHMERINSAVRWTMWLNEEPYEDGVEILGDGFLVSTPFGSTAYFNKLTRGAFTKGLGIAFKATPQHTNHLVVPADTHIRFLITRGPAQLAYDSTDEVISVEEGDELHIAKAEQSAAILTVGPVKRLDEPF